MFKFYCLLFSLLISSCINYKQLTTEDLENIDPNDFNKIQAYVLFDKDNEPVIYECSTTNKKVNKNIESGKALFSLNKENNKLQYLLENETPGVIIEITPKFAKVDFNEVVLNFIYDDYSNTYILDRFPIIINGLAFERIDNLNPVLFIDLKYFESEKNEEKKDIIKGKTVK